MVQNVDFLYILKNKLKNKLHFFFLKRGMLYIFYLMHFARFPLLQVLPLVKPLYIKVRKKLEKKIRQIAEVIPAHFGRLSTNPCVHVHFYGKTRYFFSNTTLTLPFQKYICYHPFAYHYIQDVLTILESAGPELCITQHF